MFTIATLAPCKALGVTHSSRPVRLRAALANNLGVRLARRGQYATAIMKYHEACCSDPGWFAPWLNLGIAYKNTRQWEECLDYSLRALELDPLEAGHGALWHAGLAATALGDWVQARRAWEECGVHIPKGEGPIDVDLGETVVRVVSQEDERLVWCRRIDPVRARVLSVPRPPCVRRHGDLLLHDVEATGALWRSGCQLTIFDELTILERSAQTTWEVCIDAPTIQDRDALIAAFRGTADAIEDWTDTIGSCSAIDSDNEEPPSRPQWKVDRRVGLAIRDHRAFDLLRSWQRAGSGRSWQTPTCVS